MHLLGRSLHGACTVLGQRFHSAPVIVLGLPRAGLGPTCATSCAIYLTTPTPLPYKSGGQRAHACPSFLPARSAKLQSRLDAVAFGVHQHLQTLRELAAESIHIVMLVDVLAYFVQAATKVDHSSWNTTHANADRHICGPKSASPVGSWKRVGAVLTAPT